jgi:hypothetical protein
MKATVRILLVAISLAATSLNALPAAAVDGAVVINEIMYNPASAIGAEEFLELHNPGDTAVSLEGMSFSAGITGTFGPYDLAPGEYVVVSPSAATTVAIYGVSPVLEYGGGLRNSSETVTLVASDGVAVIDSVTYFDGGVWPSAPDGLGPSLELVDPLADNNNSIYWASSVAPTPAAANSTLGSTAPAFSQPTVTPPWPNPGQTVSISLDISNTDTADLVYRVMHGTELTLTMTKSGDTFSAVVPAHTAGDLVRYRIETNGGATLPLSDDSIEYLGYVTKNPVTTDLPTFEWFITDEDFVGLYSEESRTGPVELFFPSVVAYEGVVYTGVQVKIRGGANSRANSPKQSLSVEFPKGYKFVAPQLFEYPVDEFALKYDNSLTRPEVAWHFVERAGLLSYTTFRTRFQKNGDFHAHYRIKEKFDDEWRKFNDNNDGQLFKLQGVWEKKNPKDGDFSDINALVTMLESGPTQSELWETFDIPNVVNYWAVSAAMAHQDQSAHNKYIYFDEVNTGQWRFVPWDLDLTWGLTGAPLCATDNMVTLECFNTPYYDAFWAYPDFREMYWRRLRSFLDGAFSDGSLEAVSATILQSLLADQAEEDAEWGPRDYLLPDDLNLPGSVDIRRQLFEGDARVPTSQLTNPSPIISEISYNPQTGHPQFVELFNPYSEWLDLSLWNFDGLGLTIPGGTVLSPNGYLVLTNDRPLFQSVYQPGADYLVAQSSVPLSPLGGTISLHRPDGSVADTVTYDDVSPWDTAPAAGIFTLELSDLNSDNSVATNWHTSGPIGGTPGQANSPRPDGPETTPPTVLYPDPNVYVDQNSPVVVSGSISDNESPISELILQAVVIDIGHAAADGVDPDTYRYFDPATGVWTDGSKFAPEFHGVPIAGDGSWSVTWDPADVNGSVSVGLRAFDAAANKWPSDKPWQAVVVLHDASKPTATVDTPTIVGNTIINFSGTMSDLESPIRRGKIILAWQRDLEPTLYWNGAAWVTYVEANPDIDILRQRTSLASVLANQTDWSFSVPKPGEAGRVIAVVQPQNGSYQLATGVVTSIRLEPV